MHNKHIIQHHKYKASAGKSPDLLPLRFILTSDLEAAYVFADNEKDFKHNLYVVH